MGDSAPLSLPARLADEAAGAAYLLENAIRHLNVGGGDEAHVQKFTYQLEDPAEVSAWLTVDTSMLHDEGVALRVPVPAQDAATEPSERAAKVRDAPYLLGCYLRTFATGNLACFGAADAPFTPAPMLRHDFVTSGPRLPFPDGSFESVFSEHVIEHVPPHAAVPLLAEMWRLVAPGGTIRVTTPDLKLWAAAYVADDRAFLDEAARRIGDGPGVRLCSAPACPEGSASGGTSFGSAFQFVQVRAAAARAELHSGLARCPRLTSRPSLSSFQRAWGHVWWYDFDTLRDALVAAGVPRGAVARDSYRAASLPLPLRRADREDRNHESLYVVVRKPGVI